MSREPIDGTSAIYGLTTETICAHCGKLFERPAKRRWGWCGHGKNGSVRQGVYYCTYGCMRAAEAGKECLRGDGYTKWKPKKGEAKK